MKNIFRINFDTNRVFGLDILRALAILFVVVEHGRFLLPITWRRISYLFDGVPIFFVLSGFLIGGILIKIIDKNGINKEILLNFWIRRWFRTLPTYFLILLILCFLHLLFIPNFTFQSVYKYFIFSQNVFQKHPTEFFPEAWSLSIEEWFYLIVPILIGMFTLLKMTPKKSILTTSILLILVITLIRYYRYTTMTFVSIDDWDLLLRKQVITRLDSLMFGVIGAYIYFYHSAIWLKFKKPLLLFGIFLFLFSRFIIPRIFQIDSLFFTVFSFSIISIATLSLLPYLSTMKTGKGFFYKSITYISLISYSMYLLNLSILQYWILNKIPWHYLTTNENIISITNYILYWTLLILFSILLYKYFEIPMTKLRDNKKLQTKQFKN
jgi:peptidoglycan/LPS O-acetylase OafA/YrhL